ncbi:MAG: hypothetical protein ACRD9W_22725, partial [Terriglobia bacterium]
MSAADADKTKQPTLLNAVEYRILRLLLRAARPLGAYKIQNFLDIRYPITVYRALARLARLGVVRHLVAS